MSSLHTRGYWRLVLEENDGDEQKLKDIVLKDTEVVGILAALVLTITVAVSTVVHSELKQPSYWRLIYVTLGFCSFIFSLISLMIASRLLLSINKLHPRKVLRCLELLEKGWASVDGFWWFHRSLIFLLLSVLISVYLLYGQSCFIICCVLGLLPGAMMWHLHRAHVGVVWPLINLVESETSDSDKNGLV
ncbi:unnamed protein product [Durusdinium trenchii]|uniref:Co-chaperone protein HscB-like n=2 Tax=Durusdinium trenchii TaxID=1381693 RepID=A0ABP0H5I7_9DINO